MRRIATAAFPAALLDGGTDQGKLSAAGQMAAANLDGAQDLDLRGQASPGFDQVADDEEEDAEPLFDPDLAKHKYHRPAKKMMPIKKDSKNDK